MKDIKKKESAELARRVKLYRKGKKPPLLTGKTAILVDDGLATGITAKAAAIAAKRLGAKRIIFAAPVCSFQGKRQIEGVVDEIIYISEPEDMKAVGLYYKHFEQVSDKKVIEILTK